MHILYVEDHPDTARAMQKLLNRHGHIVDLAHTASAAIQQCAEKDFDLWIIDLGLPDQHGGSLLQVLRRMHDANAIALTGYGTQRDIEEGLDDGFNDYLVKPASSEQIFDAVNRFNRNDDPRKINPPAAPARKSRSQVPEHPQALT